MTEDLSKERKALRKAVGELFSVVLQLGCFVVLVRWGWHRFSGTDLVAFYAGVLLLQDAAQARFTVKP